MDTHKLEAEILRIATLPEIQRDHEIQRLWKHHKDDGLRKQMIRKLVLAQANAANDARAQDDLQVLLDEYFLINNMGKVRIGKFTEGQLNGHRRRRLEFQTRRDFELLFAGRPEGALWLNSRDKRIYNGLLTDPDKPGEHDGKLNLWDGFGVRPVHGDATQFVDYVNVILAQGNETWRDYILNWLAWVVQNPGERIGVVLCLISARQGTGKGTLGNLMLNIFGQHGRSINDSEGLTGHFNAMLADALFVFADEALFAGDRSGADRFKNRITEPWISITHKGVDSIQMENRVSYMMASNHRFAANIDYSDRRFAMFEVSAHPQKRIYWEQFHKWLQCQGQSIVLGYLQSRDLGGFHPVDSRPLTPIYLEARRQSLSTVNRWWSEVLETEDLSAGANPYQYSELSSGEIEKKRLYALYRSWHEKTGHRAANPLSQSTFWQEFYAMTAGADVRQARPGPRGEQTRVVVLPVKGMPTGLPTAPIDWMKLSAAFEQWLSQR